MKKGRKRKIGRSRRNIKRAFKNRTRLKPRSRSRVRTSRKSKTAAQPISERKIRRIVKQMKAGKSLTRSAQAAGVSPSNARQLLKSAKLLKKRRGRWIIRADVPTRMLLYSDGEAKWIIPANGKARSAIGKFMNAVRTFLTTNNPESLVPFVGKSARDITGNRHSFETDENTLYAITSTGRESVEEIYRYIP
jgi:hypothetical protein